MAYGGGIADIASFIYQKSYAINIDVSSDEKSDGSTTDDEGMYLVTSMHVL